MSEKNPYDISDVDLSKINDNTKRHDIKLVAQLKWLLELGLSVKAISDAMHVPQGTITQIRRCITHKDVKSEFPVNLIAEGDIETVKERLEFLQANAKMPKGVKKPTLKRKLR